MTAQVIHSPRNKRFKLAVKLREHKARLCQRRILIDGLAELRLALQSSLVLDELFVCAARMRTPAAQAMREAVEGRGVTTYDLAASLWDRLAYGNRQEGLLATAHMPSARLEDMSLPNRPLIVVLDRVEKPGNIGAVIRTADAAGAHAVVLADGTSDLYNPNAIRASLGTVFTMTVVAAPAADVIRWLRQFGLTPFVATLDAPTSYFDGDYTSATALVLGSEAEGVGPRWQGTAMQAVSVPMLGQADSLNVSVTAGVLLYEVVRQRAGRHP